MNSEETKENLISKIAQLEVQVHELEKDLIHDSLTGLKTRAFFEEEAKTYLASIRDVDGPKRKEWFGFKHMSFVFLDIDHFKSVNDTHGHAVGDAVLRKVADAVAQSLRTGDTAARWGGEEMVVALLGAGEEDGFHTGLRINELVKSLRFQDAPELRVTISSGVASAEDGVSFEDLIKRADKALYAAKESGRNTVIKYSELEK